MTGNTASTTIEQSGLIADLLDRPAPGLVLIFRDGKPLCVPFRLDYGPLEVGRLASGSIAPEGVIGLDDDRVSRRHTRIALRAGSVHITDLDSRNGTFVDGRRIRSESFPRLPRILRVGQSLFLFVPDIRIFEKGAVEVQPDEVIGPTLRKARDAITRAAEAGDPMLLTGPSGAGKELAARAFHAAWTESEKAGAQAAFVAVNCAAIPTGLAERLLFGARKGAYSGASSDAEGYVQAADGGTLFLDEVAELDLSVQPKLLRMLEQKEVLSLGASTPRKVSVRICAATLKDLRSEIQAGRFREDLYYRIGRPEVRLPALVERLEDLPFLVQRELDRVDPKLSAHPLFIEACALRSWPGNVRELLAEIRRAAREALADGRSVVKDKDLAPTAGLEIATESRTGGDTRPLSSAAEPSREVVEAALKREQGNVTAAARVLGWHRNQLRRWITKNAVDPKTFGPAGDAEEEGPSGSDGDGA